MAISLTHTTVAVGTDAGNGEIAKAQWNENHTLTQATERLLGRTTAGVGATEEISVGTGLSLSGGTLTNTVTATTPGGSDTQIQFNNAGAFAGASGLTTNGTDLTLGSSSQLLWSTDLILTRRGAANLQLGAATAAGSSITVSSVDTTAETVTLSSAHGLSSGAAVQFTTTNTLPGGITAGITYFVRVTSTTAFELYDTYGNATAVSGTTGRINIISAGTGTHTCNFGLPFQKLSLQSFTGTNIPGQPFVITGSQGTGTGVGGSIIFQVAPAGTTGTAQNALATALTIGADFNQPFINTGGLEFRGNGSSGSTFRNQGTTFATINNAGAVYFNQFLCIGATGNLSGDVFLLRDAANTLALRNGNNGQTFRIYGRFTDITNDFERFFISAPTTSGAAVQLGTQKGATTGTARALELQTDGTTRLTIATDGVATFAGEIIGRAGSYGNASFRFGANNAYVIGSTNRIRFEGGGGATIGYVDTDGWAIGGTFDCIITRDAANTLALRNGTNAQESRIYGSYTSATNFQRMSIKTLRESSGALSGASYTTTITIPAYANLIGVTTRVTTAITGATTYDVGDGTDVDLWGAAIGIALGSQSRTADFTAVAAVGAAATSRTVTLTANGSNFTGGVVEICMHYLTTEAD